MLRKEVDETLERISGKHIVFDMQGVTFMDSSGIGAIIGRYKLVQTLGGKICIVSTNVTVDQMLKFSAISKIMPSFSSVDKAVEFLEGGQGNGI